MTTITIKIKEDNNKEAKALLAYLKKLPFVEIENTLLNDESIIGYEPNGLPITKTDFINEIKALETQIEKGTLKGFSTDEVRKFVLGK